MANRTISVSVGGLDEVLRNLAGVKQTIRGKLQRKAIAEVSRYVKRVAKARTPKGTGLLSKSMGERVRTYQRDAVTVGIVGPRHGFRKTQNVSVSKTGRQVLSRKGSKRFSSAKPYDPVSYAHLVEDGRRDVRPVKRKVMASAFRVYGKFARPVPARPFLAPAWALTRKWAEQKIATVLRAGIAHGG